MQEEVLAPTRSIDEVSIKGRDKPYFQQIKKEPLEFSITAAFDEHWDTKRIREVARWLTEQPYYQELYFTNDFGRQPERIYYALVVSQPNLIHNCLQQGYISLNFRCDSPYSYSPVYTSNEYQWNEAPLTIQHNNFATGHHNGTIIDGQGDIILNPNRTRWIDIPRGTTWLD